MIGASAQEFDDDLLRFLRFSVSGVIAAANECPVRIAALIYDPSDIPGDGRDAPQIDSVICFDAALTRRAGIGPGERLERHFHYLILRRSGPSTRDNLSRSELRVRKMRQVLRRSADRK